MMEQFALPPFIYQSAPTAFLEQKHRRTELCDHRDPGATEVIFSYVDGFVVYTTILFIIIHELICISSTKFLISDATHTCHSQHNYQILSSRVNAHSFFQSTIS